MTCFWTDKIGVTEYCNGGDGSAAFAQPQIIDNSNPADYFILDIYPACGPCFGEPASEGCEPLAITSASIVSGMAYRDSSETGCSLRYVCNDEETGAACENPDFPACGACDEGAAVLCGISFDTEAAASSWVIGEMALALVTDPVSGRTGLGILRSALNNPGAEEGAEALHYAELTVNTNLGGGFTWFIGFQNCD
jgi:hypothetical protein